MQMSESLTIGIILTLVFGAIFYYLYSRVGQSEKRVSLLENILLDLKVAMESSLVRREDLDEEEMVRSPPPPQPPTMPVEEVFHESENRPSTPVEVAVAEESAAAAPVLSNSDQYDKMSNKELKEAAKVRKIKGYTSMGRSELQEVLRRGDTEPSSAVALDMSDGVMTLDA